MENKITSMNPLEQAVCSEDGEEPASLLPAGLQAFNSKNGLVQKA